MSRGTILGIGGVFFKSDDKSRMQQWYEHHLGLQLDEHSIVQFKWREAETERKHTTVWSVFPRASKYYDGPFMINYIVDDLDALLARLASEGVKIEPKRQSDAATGKFAWIYDSEGNKIELWEPVAAVNERK